MRMVPCTLLFIVLAAAAPALDRPLARPFESPTADPVPNAVDEAVRAVLEEQGIEPAPPCSDEVFLRRVYLDVVGALPQPWEVRLFLDNASPSKRARLIDKLLADPRAADYRALKWGDILRIKAEFPINLWPNAVQAYHRWIRGALLANMPYDAFARALLTSSGSNFRVPQVNFYRAIQGTEPESIAAAVALTFMGMRTESWSEAEREALAAFFSAVAYKRTAEWKEEIVYCDPAPRETFSVVFPDGTKGVVPPGEDPRAVFADWLITPENPYFTRAMANRVWSWFFGRGIVHEADDFRPDNPPSNPALLTLLEKELVEAGFDLQHLYRLILNSATYQQSSIPAAPHPEAEQYFACYPMRQLEAEVLLDAFTRVAGSGEEYESPIPEPFTFVPRTENAVNLADGSITSPFLEMFGRPSRDTGLESERLNVPNPAQRLYLINSSHIQSKIERSWRLKQLVGSRGKNTRALITELYLNLLSRFPTEDEMSAALAYFETASVNRNEAATDLAWALVNSKEFLCRH